MYKSLIDGHECQDHHYLVELVIAREAKKYNKLLPPKFWNTDEWKKKYKLQVIAARSLLKIFAMDEILSGLRCKEGCWIYSLQYRGLIDIIQNEKVKNNRVAAPKIVPKVEIQIDNTDKTSVKPIQQKRKNTLDTLESIDAELQRHSF